MVGWYGRNIETKTRFVNFLIATTKRQKKNTITARTRKSNKIKVKTYKVFFFSHTSCKMAVAADTKPL